MKLLSSVRKIVVIVLSRVWLCDAMDCSTPDFSVLHYLLEFAQTCVCWVSDAIQPSHPLLPAACISLCAFLCLEDSPILSDFLWIKRLTGPANGRESFKDLYQENNPGHIFLTKLKQGWFRAGWPLAALNANKLMTCVHHFPYILIPFWTQFHQGQPMHCLWFICPMTTLKVINVCLLSVEWNRSIYF